jgi:hypothetical protein
MTAFGRYVAAMLGSIQMGCAALVEFPDDPWLAVEGPWDCLSDPGQRPPPSASTAWVRVPVCDALLGCSVPPRGLNARLCAKLDPTCASPIPTAITYDRGAFEFEVATGTLGFDGYLSISGPIALCTDQDTFGDASGALCAMLPECDPMAPDARCSMPVYLNTLEFFNPPIIADRELAPLTLVTIQASLGIARATGTLVDPTTTGSLLPTVLDCDGVPAEGVTFSMENPQAETIRLMYVENSIPSVTRSQTDLTGSGVFIGVPEGFANVVAHNSEGERIGSAGANVAVYSNSFITLVPSP